MMRLASMAVAPSTFRVLGRTRSKLNRVRQRIPRWFALGERGWLQPHKPKQAVPRELLCASAALLPRPRVGARLRCRLILCRFGEALPLRAHARSSASELLTPRLALLKMLCCWMLDKGLLN
jgi:hypothetical protein